MTLITRSNTDGERLSTAVYSPCEKYRYALTRVWDPDGKRLLFIMLNPSKATELANDPTIERCERRATALGYGGFRVCNLFGLRETSPTLLKRARRPEGPANTTQIKEALDWTDDILCAWGVHGDHRNQAEILLPILRFSEKPCLTLGLTKHGHPRHPLYIAYKIQPANWE
ncbi:DUF1643 domain-containing protein [Rhodobacteraceae bacterium]|nr:DUF1643 domain-containing protein [Paracoccaceae bacterium]